ncbi:GNAT family N-acetyltransferase [Chitinolyticbacter meiyuanensis]|uniref:GNAT family N-acetyltransferase n=1 Tax=Chitinolyticbacter meiyuanensis TaxID=682798 RepID=UPI0011E5996C|nr:GNAT family N-acetyltransferase [Chitinolyticbacter meiyuanensis]
MQIRLLTEPDLDAVLDIQRQCYPPAWLEGRATFARKLALSPHSNWIAVDEHDVLGYFFTHPWAGDGLPALDAAELTLPARASCHFLHDLAVHPRSRGHGVAARLVAHALAWGVAQGLAEARLIAVLGAERFWHGLGFAPQAQRDARLAAYGADAVVMQRALSSP